MRTTINKKINHIFILLKKLVMGQELYAQDLFLQEELFGINEQLKDAQKANERTLRRYLDDIYQLYQHIIVIEKKSKSFSEKKVTIYRVSNKEDISFVLKFFMEKENNFTWIIQMLNEHNPFLLKGLEEDAKKDIEKELKSDENIFLFHSNPFEVLDTSKHQEIFLNLKKAVKHQECRDIHYFYQTKVFYLNVKCLKLIYAQDNWYIGIETEEEKFELLRISFIESIVYTNSKKNYNKSVINKYKVYFMRFENAMSLANIKPQKAILRASKNVAMYFEKDMKKFYKSQKFIKKFDDGSIEFSISYTQPLEVLPFIKRWLPEIELLSPNSLKKILLKELEESICTLLIE